MNYKVKIGACPEVDFAPLMKRKDALADVTFADYMALLNGSTVKILGAEITLTEGNKKVCEDIAWNLAAKYVTPLLKGWGGKEARAYIKEIFSRLKS